MKKEKTHFTVKLTEIKAAEKVKLIKEVKNCIQGLNLVQVCFISRIIFLFTLYNRRYCRDHQAVVAFISKKSKVTCLATVHIHCNSDTYNYKKIV